MDGGREAGRIFFTSYLPLMVLPPFYHPLSQTIRDKEMIKKNGEGKTMKNKSVVIVVCMLVMTAALPAVATTRKQEQSSSNQSSGNRGGLFTQLPYDPGYSGTDWYSYASAIFMNNKLPKIMRCLQVLQVRFRASTGGV